MVVVSPPSNFTLLGAQYIVDDSPFYDDNYVNGAVVPFSWEKKPGVPLMLSPNYLANIKEKEAWSHKEALVMLTPTYIDNTKVKEACENHEETSQKCSNQLLFPLPKPPAGLPISPTNTMGHISHTSNSSPKTHIHKQRWSSFQTNKRAKNTTFPMNKANIIKDDPFLKAIQACTKPSMRGADQTATCERKVQENPTKEAKEGGGRIDARTNINHSTSYNGVQKMASFSKLIDEKVLGLRSPVRRKVDDKVLNTKGALRKIDGAFDDKVIRDKAQLSKDNDGAFDDKVIRTKAEVSKDNYGAFDDKVFSSKAELSKDNYGAINDKVITSYKDAIGVKVPLRKLIIEDGKQERYNGHPAFMVASFLHQPPKHKKPITHKPVQARPHHQRSSSYGCLGCAAADNYDSIIRL